MIRKGHFFFTSDIYHSPGAQILVSLIFRLFNSHDPLYMKAFQFYCFLLIQLFCFVFLKRRFNFKIAFLFVTLLSSSIIFKFFIATLQYEVFLSLITTVIFGILCSKNEKHQIFIGIILGLLCFMAFSIRYHFVLMAITSLIFTFRQKKIFYPLLIVFVLLSSAFTANFIRNDITYVQFKNTSSNQLRWLTPLSKGNNFPYPQEDPSITPGLHYIYESPLSYSAQLLNRFGYLFSLKRDGSYIPSYCVSLFNQIMNLDPYFIIGILEVLFIFLGLFYLFRTNSKIFYLYLGLSASFYLPIFIIGATQRFILPLLPINLFLMLYGIYQTYIIVKKKALKRGPLF